MSDRRFGVGEHGSRGEALVPRGRSFDRIGTVTRLRKEGRHLIVRAVSTKPIDELTALIEDAVTPLATGLQVWTTRTSRWRSFQAKIGPT